MRTRTVDTPPEMEAWQVPLFREMGPRGGLAAVAGSKGALDDVARSGIRMRHGELPENLAQSSSPARTGFDPAKPDLLRGVR